MTTAATSLPDTYAGLRIARRQGGTSAGWGVFHEASGLPLHNRGLRLKRHACELRDELLTLGADFTIADPRAFQVSLTTELGRDCRYVARKWDARSDRGYDEVTGEFYRPWASYGTESEQLRRARAREQRGQR